MARWWLCCPGKGKEFHHPQVGASLLFTRILGDTLPVRVIYSRSSKTFSFLSSTCEASKRKRIEITATFFPLGQMVAVYTSWPLFILSTLLSLPSDQLEEIPQQGPQELEQTIPWGKEEKPLWKERVKPGGEVLFECKSVRLASTSRLSLQPTRCMCLQRYHEYEHPCLDYVEHPQLKTWAQLSSIKEKK